jgi:hypothetical protein
MKTKQMHYLRSIYFVNQPLHVLGMFIAHHRDVFTVYIQQLVRVIRLIWLAIGCSSILIRPAASQLKRITRTKCCTYTVDPRVTTGLTYEQLGLRPKFKFWLTTKFWVMTRMAFVSFSLSPDTRVCGRNSGQCIALYTRGTQKKPESFSGGQAHCSTCFRR